MRLFTGLLFAFFSISCLAQEPEQTKDGKEAPAYKNIIRYNLTGAMFLGIDKCVVFGYERILKKPNQSFSVNIGFAALPKLIEIVTDSFTVKTDQKNRGLNMSVDYRFYLKKENRYAPPHGLYIGPYYSFNHFTRENAWDHTGPTNSSSVTTNSKFNINMIGFELGYQFVLGKKKRLTLDLVMIGPAVGFYKYQVNIDSSVPQSEYQQLLDGLEQLLTQRFPGMNFVFANEQFNANGVLSTSTFGYRYIAHLGWRF